MIKTIRENWLIEFKSELKGAKQVCLVSPFITDNIVRHLLDSFKGKKIKVITRYNLNDFRKGVSSLTAIKKLIKAKAEIKSVKGLHSKLYLFDEKSVIITSANFTNGGFFTNKEFGVLSNEFGTVSESKDYFQSLWEIDPNKLELSSVINWDKEISESRPSMPNADNLKDYGASYKEKITQKRRYFIKFFGTSGDRAPESNEIVEEVKYGCSHFALSFSKPKNDARPKRYKDGDIVFMARMTNTNDYSIFGRATTVRHDHVRDVASATDIKNVWWLKEWPILVRVKNPKFIDSTLSNCPKMNQMIDELGYESFESTLNRFKRGERNINPKNSLMRKGDVTLSSASAVWLENKFEESLDEFGAVSDSFVSSLYQGLKI